MSSASPPLNPPLMAGIRAKRIFHVRGFLSSQELSNIHSLSLFGDKFLEMKLHAWCISSFGTFICYEETVCTSK